MRLPDNRLLPLAALALLGGCVFGGGQRPAPYAPVANGPGADYPVVLGDAFAIDGVTHTPTDQLNYDAVGHASVAPQNGVAISASHKTLPLPSYVEVTSLESGKTILVRVENRGPMTNNRLLELSPAAAVQLGFADGDKTPVRVRRVNPPEPERALLRADKPAPARMDTPEPLLKVLNRKLAENSPLATSPTSKVAPLRLNADDAAEKPEPQATSEPQLTGTRSELTTRLPVPSADSTVAAVQPTKPEPATDAKPSQDGLVVQVAAFSSQQRADGAAEKLGAIVSKPGKFWIVRLGPFGSQGDASTGLAKARAAGYSDARIMRVN